MVHSYKPTPTRVLPSVFSQTCLYRLYTDLHPTTMWSEMMARGPNNHDNLTQKILNTIHEGANALAIARIAKEAIVRQTLHFRARLEEANKNPSKETDLDYLWLLEEVRFLRYMLTETVETIASLHNRIHNAKLHRHCLKQVRVAYGQVIGPVEHMAMFQQVMFGSLQETEMAERTCRFIPELIDGYVMEEFVKMVILRCMWNEVHKVW